MVLLEVFLLLLYQVLEGLLDLSSFGVAVRRLRWLLVLLVLLLVILVLVCLTLGVLIAIGITITGSSGQSSLLFLLSQFLLVVLRLAFAQQNRIIGLVVLDEGRVEDLSLEQLELGQALDLEDNIFRLQVRVNNLADAMQIVQAHQDLLCDLSDNGHWDTLIIEAFDQAEHVVSQHFECHDRVTSIHGMVHKLVEHLQVVRVGPRHFKLGILEVLAHGLNPLWPFVVVGYFKQDFFFFEGALGVLVCALLDLERIHLLVLELKGEPHG